jgi:hypothetical protein
VIFGDVALTNEVPGGPLPLINLSATRFVTGSFTLGNIDVLPLAGPRGLVIGTTALVAVGALSLLSNDRPLFLNFDDLRHVRGALRLFRNTATSNMAFNGLRSIGALAPRV